MKSQFKRGQYTLTKNQAETIINSTENFRDRVILKCLYYGGMRVFEVAKLKREDIDFYNRTITIIGKGSGGGKVRTIPFINSNFMADLKHFIGYKEGMVFGITKRQIQWICQFAGINAQIQNPNPLMKHINAHLFRHSIARQLKSDGYSAEFIQNFLGHSSITTTMDTYGTMNLLEMQKQIISKTGDTTLLPQLKYHVPEVVRE